MLPGQHGGGHQNGGLFAVQDAFHDGTEGHFGFAVAHVAAQKSVHGPGLLHVLLDLGNTAELIVGLGIFKLIFKFPHPGGVGGKGVARLALPLGVELNEALGQILDRLSRPGLGLFPVGSPQFGELFGLLGILATTNVFVHQVQLGGGHIEHVRPGVGDFQIVLDHAVHLHLDHLLKASDAVVLVDHQVARRKVSIGAQLGPVGHRFLGLFLGGNALSFGEDGKAGAGELQTGGQSTHGDDRPAGGRQFVQVVVHGGF